MGSISITSDSLEDIVVFMTWSKGFIRIAQDKEISAESYRVLFVIFGFVEDGMFSPITPVQIAIILSAHQSNVKRALRLLVAKRIIKKRYVAGKLVGFEIVKFFDAVGAEEKV
jgi:DNA-binding MarR family transcriptional regulator